jgi:uncharacterized membrane protein YjjB (DUF3815 family)
MLGWAVYLAVEAWTDITFLAYLTAAAFGVLYAELLARRLKTPATLFVIPAIVPLVPGVGLYNTMRYVVDGEYNQAVSTGVFTLLAICGIALAVTITSVLFSAFAVRKKGKNP